LLVITNGIMLNEVRQASNPIALAKGQIG
jgi:hypothetical protein